MKRLVRSFTVSAGTALLTLGLYGCARSVAPLVQTATAAAAAVDPPSAQSAAAAVATAAPGGLAAGTESMVSDEMELPALDHMRELAGFGGAYVADDANWRTEVWRRLEADAALSGAPAAFLIVGPATADALIEWSSDVNTDGIRLEMPNRAPDAGGCLPLRLENTGPHAVYVRLDSGDFHLDGDAVIEVRPGEFADVERIPVERLTADGGVCFEIGYGLEREMPEECQIVWQFEA